MHLDPELTAETSLSDRGRRRLHQIAEAIGCSIGDFFDGGTRRPDLAGAAELIALWNAVADETGRAKLLACARDAAAARGRP